MKNSIVIFIAIFLCSCEGSSQLDPLIALESGTTQVSAKKPCPITLTSEHDGYLKINTNESEECLQLSYGSNGLEWPVFLGVSYLLKSGGERTGKSSNRNVEVIRNSDVSFSEIEMGADTVLRDIQETGLEISEVEGFYFFSEKDQRIKSNKCSIYESENDKISISCLYH